MHDLDLANRMCCLAYGAHDLANRVSYFSKLCALFSKPCVRFAKLATLNFFSILVQTALHTFATNNAAMTSEIQSFFFQKIALEYSKRRTRLV